jgi:hypothetical protein
VTPAPFGQPAADHSDRHEPQGQHQEQPADPGAEAVTVREVVDAWRRVTGRLRATPPTLTRLFGPARAPLPSPPWKVTSATGSPTG